MKHKSAALIALVVLMVASPMAGLAAASHTAAFNGNSASTGDQTNVTVFTQNQAPGNFTVQTTKSVTLAAGGSKEWTTNVTPSSASASANKTVSVNTVNNGVWVNDSATTPVKVSNLNITFNTSQSPNVTSGTPDAVNLSKVTSTKQNLTALPSGTEVQWYKVVDHYGKYSYNVTGVSANFNQTSGNLTANQTGYGQIHFTVTRNNSTYQNDSVQTLKYRVALNNSQFSHIKDQSPESTSGIVLSSKSVNGNFTTFVWKVENPNNTTQNYHMVLNASIMGGQTNNSVHVDEIHDPVGGQQASYNTTFGMMTAGGAAPNFNQTPLGIPLWEWAIGIIAIGFVIYFLIKGKNNSAHVARSGMGGILESYAAGSHPLEMWTWIIGLLIGLSMIANGLLPDQYIQYSFNFWTNLLGVSNTVVIIVGVIFVAVAGGIDLMQKKSMMG